MYVKYAYNTSAIASEVLSDIISIICGNSSFSGLSASFDSTRSLLLANSRTSNWAVYDSAATATSQVVRSLNRGGAVSGGVYDTRYKYAHIDLTGNTLTFKVWEKWAVGSHAGTNQAACAGELKAPTFTISPFASGGYLFILVTSNYIFIFAPHLNAYYKVGVFEFSHDTYNLTDAYPFHGIYAPDQAGNTDNSFLGEFNSSGTKGGLGLTRTYDNGPISGDLVGTNIAYMYANLIGPSTASTSIKQTSNPSGNYGSNTPDNGTIVQAMPYVIYGSSRTATSESIQIIGAILGDIKAIPANPPAFSTGSEINIDGIPYILFQEDSEAPVAGLHALAIPRL